MSSRSSRTTSILALGCPEPVKPTFSRLFRERPTIAAVARPKYLRHVRSWAGPTVPDTAESSTLLTHKGHFAAALNSVRFHQMRTSKQHPAAPERARMRWQERSMRPKRAGKMSLPFRRQPSIPPAIDATGAVSSLVHNAKNKTSREGGPERAQVLAASRFTCFST